MKKKLFVPALLAGLLVLGLAFAGCKQDTPGGGGNVVTIKNSTTVKITGISIDDAEQSGGFIVGSDDEYAAVSIGPGETYTSPEINCKYVSIRVKLEDGSAAWYATDHRNFEVTGNAASYELEEK
jgi:hypothetical protein